MFEVKPDSDFSVSGGEEEEVVSVEFVPLDARLLDEEAT